MRTFQASTERISIIITLRRGLVGKVVRARTASAASGTEGVEYSREVPRSGMKMRGFAVVGKGGTLSNECELSTAGRSRSVDKRLSLGPDERRSRMSKVAVDPAERIAAEGCCVAIVADRKEDLCVLQGIPTKTYQVRDG